MILVEDFTELYWSFQFFLFIIKLITETLTEFKEVDYIYDGMTNILNPNPILLDFSIVCNYMKGDFTVSGFIDVPLNLQPQYDTRPKLNDHLAIQERITQDLKIVSAYINQRI